MYNAFNSFTDYNKSDTTKSFYYFFIFHIKFRIYCLPLKFAIVYVIGWVSLTDECIPLEVFAVVED